MATRRRKQGSPYTRFTVEAENELTGDTSRDSFSTFEAALEDAQTKAKRMPLHVVIRIWSNGNIKATLRGENESHLKPVRAGYEDGLKWDLSSFASYDELERATSGWASQMIDNEGIRDATERLGIRYTPRPFHSKEGAEAMNDYDAGAHAGAMDQWWGRHWDPERPQQRLPGIQETSLNASRHRKFAPPDRDPTWSRPEPLYRAAPGLDGSYSVNLQTGDVKGHVIPPWGSEKIPFEAPGGKDIAGHARRALDNHSSQVAEESPRFADSLEATRHSGPTSLLIGDGLKAQLIGTTDISKTTRGPIETWVVRQPDQTPVLQVQIFKTAGQWEAWTGNFTRASDKELAKRVAAARNENGLNESPRLADFNSLEDLIAHAHHELGASHVVVDGANTKIYFPRGGQYPYEEATVWRKASYWHAQGPGARTGVKTLPKGAQPIEVEGDERKVAESPVLEASRKRNVPGPNDESRRRLASYIAHVMMYDVSTSERDLVNAYHLTPEEAGAIMRDSGKWFSVGGKGYVALIAHIEKALKKKEWFSAPEPKAIPGAARAYGRYVWLLENAAPPNTDQGAKDKSDIEDLQRTLSDVGFNGWGLFVDNWPEAQTYYNAAPSVYRPHRRSGPTEAAAPVPRAKSRTTARAKGKQPKSRSR